MTHPESADPGRLPTDRSSSRPTEIRRRGFVEVRWRQFRRAPRPVFRAVVASLAVALVLGGLYLAYDIAVGRGASLPGGDLRLAAAAVYVLGVLVSGSLLTYRFVPQPTGASGRPARSAWSAALGFFAAVPITYLVLVVLLELVRPLLA